MPAISTYINERSTEAQRATILSFQTGLFSAAMIVLFPLFGLGVSHVPYSIVYIWTLEALAIGSLAIYAITWMLHKRRAQG
jgi:MFS family permease